MRGWIVVATHDKEYPYLSGPGEGSSWGPKLSDAHRFKTRSAAWREVGRLEQEHKREDWTYAVRRVRTVRERLNRENTLLHYALTNAACILTQYIGEEHGVMKLAREALARSQQASHPTKEKR